MKKLLTAIFILWTIAASAQVYLPNPQFLGYGTNVNRIRPLAVLHLPVYTGDLDVHDALFPNEAQIRINDGVLQYYYLGAWHNAGSLQNLQQVHDVGNTIISGGITATLNANQFSISSSELSSRITQALFISNDNLEHAARLSYTGISFPSYSTTDRDALLTQVSQTIYNTNNSRFEYWDGSAWVGLSGANTLQQAFDNSVTAGDDPTIFTGQDISFNSDDDAGNSSLILTSINNVHLSSNHGSEYSNFDLAGGVVQLNSTINHYELQGVTYSLPSEQGIAGQVLGIDNVDGDGKGILAWQDAGGGSTERFGYPGEDETFGEDRNVSGAIDYGMYFNNLFSFQVNAVGSGQTYGVYARIADGRLGKAVTKIIAEGDSSDAIGVFDGGAFYENGNYLAYFPYQQSQLTDTLATLQDIRGGGTQDLQSVTDVGNTTTNSIQSLSDRGSISIERSTGSAIALETDNSDNAFLHAINATGGGVYLYNDNALVLERVQHFADGDGTLALSATVNGGSPILADVNGNIDLGTIGGGTTTSALTFNNNGSGDASGTTFNGGTARTLSYNSIGAQAAITTGTTAQYIRGDLSLATFPTNNTSFTNGAGYLTSYTETDPIASAVVGILKSNGTTLSAATAGTDYVTGSSTNTFTNKSGNNSQWTNDAGYITSSSVAFGYQPLDADLTTIAGLTATTDNFIVAVASAWASRTPSQVKTTLSLNNVENTALSTWAGSSSITTLGNIATGIWNGTSIAYSKLTLTNSIVNADIAIGAAIANSKLANSAITINGASISLGGTIDTRPTSATLTADQTITTTTLIDVPTWSIAVVAGQKYQMHVELNTSSSTTNGIKLAINVTGTPTFYVGHLFGNSSSLTANRNAPATIDGTLIGTYNTVAGSATINGDVFFTAGSTGTATVKYAASTNTDTEKMLAGSTIVLTPIQ